MGTLMLENGHRFQQVPLFGRYYRKAQTIISPSQEKLAANLRQFTRYHNKFVVSGYWAPFSSFKSGATMFHPHVYFTLEQ